MTDDVLKIVPDHRFLFKPVKNCASDGCHMDVWVPDVPDGQACPLAIMIHGGAFSHGSTGDIGVNQLEWFLEHGVAVVSLEYRLAPHVKHSEIREDILDAYTYIQDQLNAEIKARSERGPTIDTTRCIATGGSAGGTGSLYLAADIERHNRSSTSTLPTLQAVLAGYPMVASDKHFNAPRAELAKLMKNKPDVWQELVKIYNEPVCCSDPYQENVMATDVPFVPRNLWVKAAMESKSLNSFLFGDPPYPPDADLRNLLTPFYPPTWLYCALEDNLIPFEQSLILKAALDGLGVECKADKVQAPHGFIDLPTRYFPDKAQEWWVATIEPSLKWALGKMKAA